MTMNISDEDKNTIDEAKDQQSVEQSTNPDINQRVYENLTGRKATLPAAGESPEVDETIAEGRGGGVKSVDLGASVAAAQGPGGAITHPEMNVGHDPSTVNSTGTFRNSGGGPGGNTGQRV